MKLFLHQMSTRIRTPRAEILCQKLCRCPAQIKTLKAPRMRVSRGLLSLAKVELHSSLFPSYSNHEELQTNQLRRRKLSVLFVKKDSETGVMSQPSSTAAHVKFRSTSGVSNHPRSQTTSVASVSLPSLPSLPSNSGHPLQECWRKQKLS